MLARLESDLDAWVASADSQGAAYLVPLSFLWDGATLTMVTPEESPTGRNLRAAGKVRCALGTTRDVVMIDGTVEVLTLETVPAQLAQDFADRHWDPRESRARYAFYRITPVAIQAWREENELKGRTLMRDGHWFD